VARRYRLAPQRAASAPAPVAPGAIGAAYTAQLADRDRTEAFGEIVVPLPPA